MLFVPLVVATVLFGAASAHAATQLSSTTYAAGSTVTWTAANSPYVLNGNVTVAAGATLTIEPGVVVKLNGTSRQLSVSGRLVASGTASDRVVFTSLQDDSVAGDTGGDGLTSGAAGQWYRIEVRQGGWASLSYATVRYGDSPAVGSAFQAGAVEVRGGELEMRQTLVSHSRNSGVRLVYCYCAAMSTAVIEDSVLINNRIGLSSYDAQFLLSNSRLRDNGQRGVWARVSNEYAGSSEILDSDVVRNGQTWTSPVSVDRG